MAGAQSGQPEAAAGGGADVPLPRAEVDCARETDVDSLLGGYPWPGMRPCGTNPRRLCRARQEVAEKEMHENMVRTAELDGRRQDGPCECDPDAERQSAGHDSVGR